MTFDGPSIGRRVAHYRRMNGWSMADLADRTRGGVGKGVIANIETGRKSDVTIKQLVDLSMALEVSPAALMVDLDDLYTPIDLFRPEPGEVQLDGQRFVTWLSGSLSLRPGSPGRFPLPSRDRTEAILDAVLEFRRLWAEQGRELGRMLRAKSDYERALALEPEMPPEEKALYEGSSAAAERIFEYARNAAEDAERRLRGLMRDGGAADGVDQTEG